MKIVAYSRVYDQKVRKVVISQQEYREPMIQTTHDLILLADLAGASQHDEEHVQLMCCQVMNCGQGVGIPQMLQEVHAHLELTTLWQQHFGNLRIASPLPSELPLQIACCHLWLSGMQRGMQSLHMGMTL